MRAPRPDLSTAAWRKSSYSNGGDNNCVEVAEGFPGAARWRKSSYSNGGQNNCLEVADDIPRVVPVRDSKNPGPTLVVLGGAWQAFVAHVTARQND
jgi:hypothetical protein